MLSESVQKKLLKMDIKRHKLVPAAQQKKITTNKTQPNSKGKWTMPTAPVSINHTIESGTMGMFGESAGSTAYSS